MSYLRIENGVAVEEFVPAEDFALADYFPEAVAKQFVEKKGEAAVGWTFDKGKFFPPVVAEPNLDDLKARRVQLLRDVCEATITGGFKSSALGAAHTYPSDIKAQINLMGSVTDSIMPDVPANWTTPFWVCDAAGVWAWKMHDAAQIQQAGRDGKAHVVSCQTLLAELTEAVLAAATAEAVASVEWPETTSA